MFPCAPDTSVWPQMLSHTPQSLLRSPDARPQPRRPRHLTQESFHALDTSADLELLYAPRYLHLMEVPLHAGHSTLRALCVQTITDAPRIPLETVFDSVCSQRIPPPTTSEMALSLSALGTSQSASLRTLPPGLPKYPHPTSSGLSFLSYPLAQETPLFPRDLFFPPFVTPRCSETTLPHTHLGFHVSAHLLGCPWFCFQLFPIWCLHPMESSSYEGIWQLVFHIKAQQFSPALALGTFFFLRLLGSVLLPQKYP